MNIIISNSGERPIYEQITNQIKALVKSGQLKEGDALPSMRTLARNMAFLMKSVALGKEKFGLPRKEKPVRTNFVR